VVIRLVDSANGDGIKTVCVPVKVAVVHKPSSVARSKHIDGSQASATALDTLAKGFSDKRWRTVHGTSVIGRTPRARVNIVLLVSVGDTSSLVDLGDVRRQDPDSSDASGIGHPDSAFVVPSRGNFSGTTSAMPIIRKFGSRVRRGIGAVEVPGTFEELFARIEEIMLIESVFEFPE
jgi:hypothetical protein